MFKTVILLLLNLKPCKEICQLLYKIKQEMILFLIYSPDHENVVKDVSKNYLSKYYCTCPQDVTQCSFTYMLLKKESLHMLINYCV